MLEFQMAGRNDRGHRYQPKENNDERKTSKTTENRQLSRVYQTHCSVISNHLLDGSYPGKRVRQIELQLFRTEKSNDVQGIMQMHDEWSNRPWNTA